jgi:hypothetical protein
MCIELHHSPLNELSRLSREDNHELKIMRRINVSGPFKTNEVVDRGSQYDEMGTKESS